MKLRPEIAAQLHPEAQAQQVEHHLNRLLEDTSLPDAARYHVRGLNYLLGAEEPLPTGAPTDDP